MRYVDQSHAQRKEYEAQADTGCWLIESHRPDGYSRIRRGLRLVMGHVWFFEEYREKIPEGMTLDHLCRVRNCVNPAHMEVISQAENNRRRAERESDIMTLEELEYEVESATGCWIANKVQRDGYSRVFVGGNVVSAHRVMYVRHRGGIPSWKQLDHLCCKKSCINPWHLEVVTRIENVRRAIARTRFNSLHAAGIEPV